PSMSVCHYCPFVYVFGRGVAVSGGVIGGECECYRTGGDVSGAGGIDGIKTGSVVEGTVAKGGGPRCRSSAPANGTRKCYRGGGTDRLIYTRVNDGQRIDRQGELVRNRRTRPGRIVSGNDEGNRAGQYVIGSRRVNGVGVCYGIKSAITGGVPGNTGCHATEGTGHRG